MAEPLRPGKADIETIRDVFEVTPDAQERLELYVSLLMKWQQKTNLIAPSTIDDIWSRHIADSLQCISLLPGISRWADIGSGGGLPGIVTAIILVDRPDTVVHLIESNKKKAAFLRSVSRELGLKTKIHDQRIESAAKQITGIEAVSARALASLPRLFDLAEPLLQQSVGLFHKGRDYRREIEDCSGLWKFDLVEHPSKIEQDSVLLEVRNLRRAA